MPAPAWTGVPATAIAITFEFASANPNRGENAIHDKKLPILLRINILFLLESAQCEIKRKYRS